MTLHAIFPAPLRPAEQRAAASVRLLAAQLVATLSTARVLIECGRGVDLSGAQDGVGQLCARTLDLPPAAGLELRALLLAVQDEVDLITAALNRHAPA